MFVNATAGTTVYGAFDPINEIADICEKYNMWLHVDVREHRYSDDADTSWLRGDNCPRCCDVCRELGEEVCSCPGNTDTS